MLLKRIALVALTSGVTAQAVRMFLNHTEHQRHARQKSQAKNELHRWENEGGNVVPPSMPAQPR